MINRRNHSPPSADGSPSSADAPRDYVAVAVEFAQAAIADQAGVSHGKLIRLAAARFLDDLKRAEGPSPPFIFDGWHARDACGFIECLPHVEGRWETPDIVLAPAHVFFVVQLFGFRKAKSVRVRGVDGEDWDFHPRRFTSALFAVARKNAKSTLAAAIMIYCECCEPEEGAQLISAATTHQQASVIFKLGKRMVEATPDLRTAFGLTAFSRSVVRAKYGSVFRAIHAKASTQDGLNPSHVALDEIHAHKTSDLVNVLGSAAGGRDNPLWLYTTTEGYANPGPWAELRQFARQILEGVFKAAMTDHFLVVFFAVDKGDSEFDEAAWRKANPLMDSNPNLLDALRREAVEARAMPSKMAEFRIKRLNRQSAHAQAWVNLERWDKCGGKVDLEWLRQHPCTAAFDLSSTTDLTSWRFVWLVNGVWYTWGRRWVPEDAVKSRTERGTVPYAGWVESGHMTSIPGDVIDYDVVEKAIVEDFERFRPTRIAYDSWNARDLVNRLVKKLPQDVLLEFIQGPRSYHPAMQEFERAYISGNIAHGDDPVLRWCAANLVTRPDKNMNLAPDKKKSPEKIDDMCALLMAMGVGLLNPGAEKSYKLFFV